MILLAGSEMSWCIAVVCAVGGLLWIWFEFRRKNRRQRVARITAAILAVLAMTSLGLRPAMTDREPATWTLDFSEQGKDFKIEPPE